MAHSRARIALAGLVVSLGAGGCGGPAGAALPFDESDAPISGSVAVRGDGAIDFVSWPADDPGPWGRRVTVSGHCTLTTPDGCVVPVSCYTGPSMLAVRVVPAGLLRLKSDEASLTVDLVPLDQPDSAVARGALELSALPNAAPSGCSTTTTWTRQLFTRGNYAYLARYVSFGDVNVQGEHRFTLFVVDLSDPSALRVQQSIELEPLDDASMFQGLLQTEHALLVGRYQGYAQRFRGEVLPDPTLSFDILDLSDPSAPRLATRFEVPSLPGSAWDTRSSSQDLDSETGDGVGHYVSTRAQVDADVLLGQHVESLEDGRVRPYLDRIDLSDPDHPVVLPSINIPGTLVHFQSATGQLVTLDYRRGWELDATPGECRHRSVHGYSAYGVGDCNVIYRELDALLFDGERAVRKSRLLLNTRRNVSNLAASNERVFFTSTVYGPPLDPATDEPGPGAAPVLLESLRLDQGQLMRFPSIELPSVQPSDGYGALIAQGARAFESDDGSLSVIDTRDPLAPEQRTQRIRMGRLLEFDTDAGAAYCAMGEGGVDVVDL